MRRTLTPELMDDPAVPRAELETSLHYLRVINRRWGGAGAILRHFQPWSARWPKDRPITILDIGTGSGDLPLAVVSWARSAGFQVRITAVDLHETVLECARAHAANSPDLAPFITFVRADARRLTDSLPPASFDYITTSLFLHHLPELDILTVLRIMDRLARAGIIWNDLIRSPLCRLIVAAAVIGRPPIVKHDAIVSVEAGFTPGEVRGFARRLDLDYARFRRGPMYYRFTLAGEKPGAW